MGWSTCVVNTCYFSKTSKHRFPNPKRNIGAFRKWVSLIGNKDLLNLSPDLVYESRRVCAAHFDQSAYGANNRLLRTAVPSLELPNPLQESELSGQQLVEPEEKKLICSIKDAKAEWKTYKAIHRDSLKRRNITKSGEAPSNIGKYVEDLEFSTPSQLLQRHGYPFEAYTVVTEDGYLLGLHRIPYGVRNTSKELGKPVALLVHGLMSQSIDFLNNEPDNSLGTLLADRGYDVWLINLRGNTHSRKHVSLNPDVDKDQFWDFSWHESGIYDLPATIDFILEHTGQSELYYFAHSRGTTAFFVMASVIPEYNHKIRLMTALAPVAYMQNNLDSSKWLMANSLTVLKLTAKLLNLHELMPHSDTILKMVKTCCYEGSLCEKECELYFNKSFGYAPTEFNMTLLPVYLSNSPSGYSVKDGFHYLQQFKNGGLFRQYDYGTSENKKKYGQKTPPEYNLKNVIAPVALHYARNDLATGYKDVEHLAATLPNCVRLSMVPLENFDHINFIWSNHIKTLVYDEVFEDLEKY